MNAKTRTAEMPAECFTIEEFCSAHRISKWTYYKLKDAGRGPEEIRTGDRRVLVSKEAAARWREQRTAEGRKRA